MKLDEAKRVLADGGTLPIGGSSDVWVRDLPLDVLLMALNAQFEANVEWNATGRIPGDYPAAVVGDHLTRHVLEALENAQASFRDNDFSRFFEHVLRARLALQAKNTSFNELTAADAGTIRVGLLLDFILRKMAGACLDYAGQMHSVGGLQLEGALGLALPAPAALDEGEFVGVSDAVLRALVLDSGDVKQKARALDALLQRAACGNNCASPHAERIARR